MKVVIHSYRFATEILQHEKNKGTWEQMYGVLKEAPLFIFPKKSAKKPKLDVVQQLMNTYFDRRFAVDLGWDYHPLATTIEDSGLAADFRKTFGDLRIQAEIQFGNMGRWYSDIFKFQTAYSQNLTNLAVSIVPTSALARRIDSNVVNYERTLRELPSAELSITIPIVLAGVEPDSQTKIYDVSKCKFGGIKGITGKGKTENRWRIINGVVAGTALEEIGPESPIGPTPTTPDKLEEPDAEEEEE